MASSKFSSLPLFFLCSFLLIISSSLAKTSSRPKALLLQVTKDAKTLQYITQVSQRTPLVSVKLTVDLGGDYMWVNCDVDYSDPIHPPTYISSTYRPARCGTAPCKLLNDTFCSTVWGFNKVINFYNDTCGHYPINPVAHTDGGGELGADVITMQSTDGKNVLRNTTVPRFYFICGNAYLRDGLASGVVGIAGLGRSGASLPAQLSTFFKFDRKFALCLSSSTTSSGVVFFGNEPYILHPDVDASSSLTYTPLIINPISEINDDNPHGYSPKYFIGVKSISINGKSVKLNKSLLSIDNKGIGGTTISTADPYTLLETSIYNALIAAFVKAMPKNVQRVPNVAPFGACFSSMNISSTHLGPNMPSIDLVFHTKTVYWRISGANSMVKVQKDVLCLGFVEAPTEERFRPRASIVIGGHQIEDNLLQFDLSASRLGFSSSLLTRSTTCDKFNFTSTA